MQEAVARFADRAGLRRVCSACSLQALCLPMDLGGRALREFDTVVECVGPLHKGEHLFRQGDPFRAIYAVRSGYLKTYADTENGEEQVLGFYMGGELLGLDSIAAGRKQCYAQVLDTALVCRLPFDDLSGVCRAVPDVQRQLLRLMSRELVTTQALSGNRAVDSRMAGFLVGWGERLARRGLSRRHFVLPMTRQDIGSYLRLATETVSRSLTRFEQQGWIETSARNVRLKDAAALEALCPEDWRL